ncbi:helix-turn-helix domain-containing protein [soil metagenome]
MPFTPHPPFNEGGLPGPLQGRAHQMRTVEAHDADEHACNLTAWEQSYDQITRGPFHGVLTELQMPQMQVFLEHTSQAVRQSCRVWSDAFWFGVQGEAGRSGVRGGMDARINGRRGDADTIMVRPGGCEFELLTPADYAIYGIVIRRNALQETARQMGCQVDWPQLARAEVLRVSESARQACLQTLALLVSPQGAASECPPAAGVAHAEQAMMMAVLSLLDTGAVDKAASNSFRRRQRIVAHARDHVLGNRNRPVTVPELCECLHVSRRTLQYCFEDVLGISPLQYLRVIRLNGARRELRQRLPDARTVGDVAAQWGFWHLSQFSSDYRKLFGQSPSESLRQRTH